MQMSGIPAHFVYYCTVVREMREIRISSFAKINFSIDVTGVREDGMHLVDMIMHQIDFHDDVCLRFYIDRQRPKGDIIIRLKPIAIIFQPMKGIWHIKLRSC